MISSIGNILNTTCIIIIFAGLSVDLVFKKNANLFTIVYFFLAIIGQALVMTVDMPNYFQIQFPIYLLIFAVFCFLNEKKERK